MINHAKIYNSKLLFSKLIENKSSKIFFWGASKVLRDFVTKNDLKEFDIEGILDIDCAKENSHFGKYKIFSPSELSKFKKTKNLKILFAITNNNKERFNTTQKLLEKLKIKPEVLENCFAKNREDVEIEEISSNRLFLVNESTGKKEQVTKIKGIEISWEGVNSTVEISYPYTKFLKTKILVGDNCHIKIGSSSYLIEGLTITARHNSTLTIGKDFSCRGALITMHKEANLSMSIGDDCMFSNSINILVSDGHTIYDDEGNILNETQELTIGDHVWVGRNVKILKNTKIPNNTIIGCASVVCKKFKQEKTIIAGCPARVIKKGANWDRRSIDTFKKERKIEKSLS